MSDRELLDSLLKHVLYCEKTADDLRNSGMVDHVDLKAMRSIANKAREIQESLKSPK